MTDERLLDIAKQYTTPSYVFDTTALKERMADIRRIVGEDIGLCYSIKANPFLIPAMLEVTDKLEVCSPGELEICMALKVPPEKIIYSGVMKTAENVSIAAQYGAGMFTAESKQHVRLVNEQGLKDNKKYKLLLRLNAGSQFGMSKEDLTEILERAQEFEGIEIAGIHYFAGTGRGKLKQQEKELDMLEGLLGPEGFTGVLELCKHNETSNSMDMSEDHGRDDSGLCKLEYGPGLPFPYFAGDDFSDTLRPLKELAPRLKEIAKKCELTIEMGRFFASECGYYLTRVMDIKSANGVEYCIIDGGINHINYYGQIMGMKVPVIRHIKGGDKSGGEGRKYAIAGSLCTTADIPVREVEFKDLEEGDLLVFCNIGAYSVTEGLYLFLSRNMPNIILCEGEKNERLVRGALHTSGFNTGEF